MNDRAERSRLRRVKVALSNPIFLAEYYVRPYDPNWKTPLAPFAKEMLYEMATTQRLVIELPPEYMKTTLGQAFDLWMTLRVTVQGKMWRAMLLAEQEDMAIGSLGVLKWHIEQNELVARDFIDAETREPILRKDPFADNWKSDSITLARPGTSRDPTWQAKGLDSTGIQGRRLDYVRGDDVVTPRNAESAALRKSALDMFDLTIEQRLVEEAKIIVMGNFNDERDLLSTLGKRKRWKKYRRPSLSVPGEPEESAKESDYEHPDRSVVLWEDVWPRRRLLEEYDDKPNRFRRVHQLDPKAEHGEKLDTNQVTTIEPSQTALRMARYFISLDGAPGGEQDDPDFVNISVGALTDEHLDLIESLDFRKAPGEQAKLVGMMYDRYQRMGAGVIAIGCPKTALDHYFRGLIQNERPDLLPKLLPIAVGVVNKEVRLEALDGYARSKWLRVWNTVWTALTSDTKDQAQELSLMEQWRDFPFAAHDDKLDGIDILIRAALDNVLVGDQTHELEVAEA